MISVPYTTIEKAIKTFDFNLQKYKTDLKARLVTLSSDKRISKNNRRYAKALLNFSDNLITAKPSSLRLYKKVFDRIISPKNMKANKSFKNRLLQTLAYDERRKDFYPKYFQEIGIGSCVYCNSMLAVSVERVTGKNKKKTIQAKFQVDHYLPKSEYPCFSISLFNLYPTCASCNNVKGKKQVQFKLYEDGSKISTSNFYFELNMLSVDDYLLNRNSDLIQFIFREPKIRQKGVETFDSVFAIQGIYDTQKSIAEELILKAEIYTKAYKSILMNKYPKILNSASIVDRLIMGNYTSEKDMHKRPMAKFMIDIAKQVGLI